jgi:tRNA (cytidine/uridine-2'-O-)-methyltransferase
VNDNPLHIILHQPEIPQNTGNIGRTCVAIRAKLWLIRPLGFRLDAKHLRRAGLDYWQHLDWQVVDSLEEVRERVDRWSPWYFSKRATQCYTRVSYQLGDALVFGCETQGLPESLLAECADRTVRIPICEQVRSLNLSSAAAVAAYEAMRQLDQFG